MKSLKQTNRILCISSVIIFTLLSCNQSTIQNRNTKKQGITKTLEKVPNLVSDTTFNFNNNTIGNLPSGWSQYFTGKGTGTEWKILADNENKILAQLSSNNPNHHFNEIVFDGFQIKNVELKVRMKGVAGKEDQGGGFIWRYTSAGNYYVVRANPLEDNVVLYKVENGKRTDLALIDKGRTYGVDVPALGNDWNDLGLKVLDNIFTVYLNGQEIFKVKDETFANAGKIGLWTKADAVTYFDDFEVKGLF